MRSKLKGIYEVLLIGIGLAVIICFIFINRKKHNARSTRQTCRTFFTLANIRLEQIGDFDERADLIVMNHQSVADILCLEAYHPRNICWIAKKQLGEIPFYGYALTGPEMILIDRDDKRGIISLLKAVKDKLSQNRPIVIFPEGTRSKGRERFLPFKPGAKLIAEKFQLTIQPIVLVNTRKIYNSKPLEATSNVARMIMLKPFTCAIADDSSASHLPSKEIFYASQASFDSAQCTAPKPRGLSSIPLAQSGVVSVPYHIRNDSQGEKYTEHQQGQDCQAQNLQAQHQHEQYHHDKEQSKDWYEHLAQCMQEVYTQHYNALNSKR